jgi:hypothetical protein
MSPGSVADAASVELTDAFVNVVADAIGIGVLRTVAPTDAQGIELVAVTVAVTLWDVGTSTLVDVAGSVADAASVERTDTFVNVVADAIGIGVLRTVAPTDAQGIELVAVTVAVTLWDVGTSTLVDVAGSVADAASVELTYAFVNVVADAIGIGVLRTVAPTDAQGIELVAVTVAVTLWDVGTSTLVDVAGSVADAASVERTDTFVNVVADAIGIGVLRTVAPTDAQGIELVAVTVAVTLWDVGTSTLVDVARSVADAASVERTDAFVERRRRCHRHRRRSAQSPPQTPEASSWLPSQSQSPSGMSEHPHS